MRRKVCIMKIPIQSNAASEVSHLLAAQQHQACHQPPLRTSVYPHCGHSEHYILPSQVPSYFSFNFKINSFISFSHQFISYNYIIQCNVRFHMSISQVCWLQQTLTENARCSTDWSRFTFSSSSSQSGTGGSPASPTESRISLGKSPVLRSAQGSRSHTMGLSTPSTYSHT